MRGIFSLSRWRGPLVAVIRLDGMIAAGPGRLNDQALAPAIEAAFRRGKPVAVALSINSPGGAPAQSSLIAARIRRLADRHALPVHAFVEDLAASGGYWLATTADDIWVDDNSIVGSIGVISASFGFDGLMARHGIERRLHTSGARKALLDPFSPQKPEDVECLRDLQAQIHGTFIDHVRARRGARLNPGQDLFDGSLRIGARAVEAGLADGIGHLVPKLKALYGEKARFQTYGPRHPLLRRFGLGVMHDALALAEERALRARYGC